MTERTYQPTVELYVRSLCPTGAHQRQEQIIDRLQTMEEEGGISDFSVTVWGRRIDIGASHTDPGRTIRDRLTEFEQWAREEGVSLSSFYRSKTVDSQRRGETVTTVTLPVMGLAEYDDGELVHVAPCTDGDTIRQIEHRLSRLRQPKVPKSEDSEQRILGAPGQEDD